MNALFDSIIVISLPERENLMKLKTKEMGTNVEFFPAILGKNLDSNFLINNGILSNNNKFKNINEIACYYSHISVIKKFYEDNTLNTLFIFEDDVAVPKDDFQTKINNIMNIIPKSWEFINFGRCWDQCNPNDGLFTKSDFALCSHSYAITKKGAKKILDNCFPMIIPLDEFYLDLMKKKIIESYVTTPRIFIQDRNTFVSSLNNDDTCSECKYNENNIVFVVLIILFVLIYIIYRYKNV